MIIGTSSVAGEGGASVHTYVSITQQAPHLLRQATVVMATVNLFIGFILKPRRQLRTTLHARYVVAMLLTYHEHAGGSAHQLDRLSTTPSLINFCHVMSVKVKVVNLYSTLSQTRL